MIIKRILGKLFGPADNACPQRVVPAARFVLPKGPARQEAINAMILEVEGKFPVTQVYPFRRPASTDYISYKILCLPNGRALYIPLQLIEIGMGEMSLVAEAMFVVEKNAKEFARSFNLHLEPADYCFSCYQVSPTDTSKLQSMLSQLDPDEAYFLNLYPDFYQPFSLGSWEPRLDSYLEPLDRMVAEEVVVKIKFAGREADRGLKILDAAIGKNCLLREINKNLPLLDKSQLYGIDLCEPFVARAKAQGFGVQPGDARLLPYPDEFFDITMGAGIATFQVMPSLEDGDKVIKELARVTKKGGMIVLTGRGGVMPDPMDYSLLPEERFAKLGLSVGKCSLPHEFFTHESVMLYDFYVLKKQ